MTIYVRGNGCPRRYFGFQLRSVSVQISIFKVNYLLKFWPESEMSLSIRKDVLTLNAQYRR